MTEPNGYPILLQLAGRRCVVIGGGKVAARKVNHLLEAGAEVVIISPTLEATLETLAAERRLQIHRSEYQVDLLASLHPWLVFAATDSRALNQQIVEDARGQNILVGAVDSVADFTSMACFHRGPITVGVATGGASPTLAVHLQRRLSSAVGEEYALLAAWLSELRPRVQQRIQVEAARKAFWQAAVDSSILDYLRSGDMTRARVILDSLCVEHGL